MIYIKIDFKKVSFIAIKHYAMYKTIFIFCLIYVITLLFLIPIQIDITRYCYGNKKYVEINISTYWLRLFGLVNSLTLSVS